MSRFHRRDLWLKLGYRDGPSPGKGGSVQDVCTEPECVIEELEINTNSGIVPATLLRPENNAVRHPAMLYCHAHGDRYDIGRSELLDGRPALHSPHGRLLASRGFVVLCADMPGFGSRQHEGSEPALAKAALWNGGTLMGQMLSNLRAAVDYLAAREDVDAERIATLGLSMGATHAYWLAALDERISAAAHLCAFANMRPLIESGAHDLHGPYMTVPGLLEEHDMADIAAMIAPRPQLVAYGVLDPLTPPEAVDPAIATLRQAYERTNASENLTVIRSELTGHVETEDMREAVLRFFECTIQNNSETGS
ncbi:MAG: alpha/beta fold hydrolase [Hyphomicrobiales bacterium]|nr:alpha/beta fold hydrolase [Hyphomicrobiales bacterium]